MSKSKGMLAARRKWTNEEDRIISEHYPHTPAKEIQQLLGCSIRALYSRAFTLNAKKTEEFLRGPHSGIVKKGEQRGVASQFKKGNQPWTTGKKIGTKGRSGETQFKKGAVPHNYLPVGTEKLNTEGFVIVKVSDTGIQCERWKFKHRLIWETENGPVPADHAVVFKDRNRLNCHLDNLELVKRSELVVMFGINSLPKELADLMKLKGAITRVINKRSRSDEQ